MLTKKLSFKLLFEEKDEKGTWVNFEGETNEVLDCNGLIELLWTLFEYCNFDWKESESWEKHLREELETFWTGGTEDIEVNNDWGRWGMFDVKRVTKQAKLEKRRHQKYLRKKNLV